MQLKATNRKDFVACKLRKITGFLKDKKIKSYPFSYPLLSRCSLDLAPGMHPLGDPGVDRQALDYLTWINMKKCIQNA